MIVQFERFFSVDSPKAIKASKYGYLNAINYMSPASSGGVGNLCPYSSVACVAICLGLESGQAAMVSRATGTNSVRQSRARKARYFMTDRNAYMREMLLHIARRVREARRKAMTLAVRPNGSTDISYEGIRVEIDAAFALELSRVSGLVVTPGRHTIFSAFPTIQFLDYTKNWTRLDRMLGRRDAWPSNYDLTFSYSGDNLGHCLRLLGRGVNVAVCFEKMPASWHGFTVIDGDKHDLRHLDPHGDRGVIVGLTPKGVKARRETLGFVVRERDSVAA